MSAVSAVRPTYDVCAHGRPRSWRRVDAWHKEELAPCGEASVLRWHYWTGDHEGTAARPNLGDCLATMIGRGRLLVWEPLITKAPGPHLAQAYCCYIQTIIFYHAPYIKSPWIRLFKTRIGWRCNGSPGHFEQWDQIECRIGWHDQIEYRGLIFGDGGGRALWTHAPGERRRWWMRRWLSRVKS